MRAALLWTTLLFGAPLPASAASADPASEADPEFSEFAEFAARIIDLSAPLLRAADQDAFFTALDTAVLKLDLSSGFAMLKASSIHELRRSLEAERARALLEFEAAVGPSWRAELRAGAAQAAGLTERLMEHPVLAHGLHLLTEEDAPTAQMLLGDLSQPIEQRRALLQYLRGLLCAGALAAGVEEGRCMSDRLAALVIPMWRKSLEQAEAALASGSFDALPPDTTSDSSPIAALLMSFQCREGDRLARYLADDPSLIPMLVELGAQIPRFFDKDALERITLGPAWNPDGDEEPALIVAIYTDQDVAQAEASLERFDHDWWLERSSQHRTRVVVDIRST